MSADMITGFQPANLSGADLAEQGAAGWVVTQGIFSTPSYLETSAWIEHVPFAFWLMEAQRPAVFVELGTHFGTSYFAFCQAVEKLGLPTRCYAIDTWKGDEHAGSYDEKVFGQVSQHNAAMYSRFSRLVRSTFDDAALHFSDGSIDLLHIDGLHTIEAVRHDFELWLPKLSKRAVVIFHDTNVREKNFGVFKLFESLSEQYPSFEFVHGHGLGVLGVGEAQSEIFQRLFAASEDGTAKRQIQEIFSRLGRGCATALTATQEKAKVGHVSDEASKHKKQIEEYKALVEKIKTEHKKQIDDLKVLHEKTKAEKANEAKEYARLRSELLEKVRSGDAVRNQLEGRATLLEEVRGQLLGEIDLLRTDEKRGAEVLEQSRARIDQLAREVVERDRRALELGKDIEARDAALAKAEKVREQREQQLATQQLALETLRHENRTLETTVEVARAGQQSQTARSEELSARIGLLEVERTDLHTRLDASQASESRNALRHELEIKGLHERVAMLEKSGADLNHELNDARATLEALNETETVLSSKLETALTELEHVQAQLRERHERVVMLEKSGAELHDELNDARAGLEASKMLAQEREVQAASIASLSERMAALTETEHALAAKLEIALTELEQMQAQLRERDQTNRQDAARLAAVQGDHAAQDVLLVETNARLQQLLAENNALQSAADEARQQFARQTALIEELRASVTQAADELREDRVGQATLQMEADDAEPAVQHLASLAADAAQLRNEHQQLTTSLSERFAEIAKLTRMYLAGKQEHATLAERLSDAERVAQELRVQLDGRAAQVKEKDDELATLRHASRALADVQAQQAEYSQRLHAATHEIAALRSDYEQRLQAATHDAASLRADFEQRLNTATREVATLRTALMNSRRHAWSEDSAPSLGARLARFTRRLGGGRNAASDRLTRRAHLIISSGLFDPDWYVTQYPDVKQANVEPAEHYLRWGASEGRDPGPLFCSQEYIAANPDVAHQQVNPLVHYINHGMAEGRPITNKIWTST